MYKVVDLFAGAGGLSLGFLQTGKFEIKVAAENNPHAQKTYKRNHPYTDIVGDVQSINFATFQKTYDPIDVVIGGPPCQGFSNANRQKENTISHNNSLVKDFVRAVCDLRPTVFVMENVSALQSTKHRFFCSDKDISEVKLLNITLQNDSIELLPDVYTSNHHDELAASLPLYNDHLWQDRDYSLIKLLYRQRNNPAKLQKTIEKHTSAFHDLVSRFACDKDSMSITQHTDLEMAFAIDGYIGKDIKADRLNTAIQESFLLQRMYKRYKELVENNIIITDITSTRGIYAQVQSYAVLEYITRKLNSSPYNYKIATGVLNAATFGAPQKRQRYVIIGAKGNTAPSLPKGSIDAHKYLTVFDAISDLEKFPASFHITDSPQKIPAIKLPQGTLLAKLRDTRELHNHVITETRPMAMERFKTLTQGQNFHDLGSALKQTYTDVTRTQNTIYLRLKYNEPSGTVVNVRKSMWIHPKLNRALSIREAARLQTFPDSFVFEGTKDSQYQQVGNAVPPILAKAIAEEVVKLLK